MRRLALAAAFLAVASAAGADITGARYDDPTTRYDHGVLGDAVEFGALVMEMSPGPARRLTLPQNRVFEDIAPRLADLDGDGTPEIIAVETDLARGARLSVYDEAGLVAATPFIGRRHRWLAPVGAADLDGDGRVEIAYVETPHLGKVLKIVRLEGGRLVPVAEAHGLTNHRIGDPLIQGRMATCDGHPTILTASADWRRIIGTALSGGGLVSRDLGSYAGPDSFSDIEGCN